MAQATSAERFGGRGREARTPKDIPASGWKDILWRVKDQVKEDRLSIIAAGVAFYGLLAIFPGLIALVAIYGLAFDPAQVEQQAAALSGVLPPQAADILLGQLHDLTTTDSTALGIGAVVGILVALWSASAGMRTLMEALNVAYDEEEKRGAIRFYGTALLLTLAAILGTIIAMSIVIALPIVLKFLGLGEGMKWLVSAAGILVLLVTVMLGLAIVYRYGPSREEPRWRWVSWGAVVATLLWIAGSVLFSIYVTRFGSYNETYGSVGAIVILLMWFLLSSYAVLIGAELNAEMERQTRKDTTSGDEKPMGGRGAHAADTLGKSK
ncbi:MAG TPA: YihY/virulence factor BrkB family protein [Burkholderiales bacterium]|nr:YihY/virulence factor BrkB family protein [Burkholderiales bacterium]